MLADPVEDLFCPPALFPGDRVPAPLQGLGTILDEAFAGISALCCPGIPGHSITSIAYIRMSRVIPSGVRIFLNSAIPMHFRVRSLSSTILSCSGS